MFKTEGFFRLLTKSNSCTETACAWNKGTMDGKSCRMCIVHLSEMNFNIPSYMKKKRKRNKETLQKAVQKKRRNVAEDSLRSFKGRTVKIQREVGEGRGGGERKGSDFRGKGYFLLI